MTERDCIFCKIVAGEIPCWKLEEGERTLTFLDVGPLSEGHALVVPREHYETLDEVPDETAAALGVAAKRAGAAVADATGCAGWNVLQNNGAVAGQAVGHVHVHISPRGEGDALGFRWPAGELSDEDAVRLQAAIIEWLQRA